MHVRADRLAATGALATATVVAVLLAGSAATGAAAEPPEALAATARDLCAAGQAGLAEMGRLAEATPEQERSFGPDGDPVRIERRFARDGGVLLIFDVLRPSGMLRRATLDKRTLLPDAERPEAIVVLDGGCDLWQARRIVRDDAGMALEIAIFGPELRERAPREPLNPPMPQRPADAEQDGVIVALFDSGLAYTLPQVARRLVYDADGNALGYDFWDMDPRPFDADTSRSPYFPARHGTRVASILLREAPRARVVPFRYPRPDMSRMGEMVAAAANAGARIVVMAMGSNDPDDWTEFADAARRHDHMLFILSAGNDGRDLDDAPLWPAALGLANALVVTSSREDGALAPGANSGAETVDLMVPGEEIEVVDHYGRIGRGSGTSYAAPRVAAMAARLLQDDPEMGSGALRQAIVARATPAPQARYGFIAAPDQ